MSDDVRLPAFRPVPRTGVIYVTTEADRARLHARRPRLVQPGPGPAGDGRAARRARRASAGLRSTSRTRSTRRSRASGSCARRSPPLQPALPQGDARQYSGGERVRLRRRSRLRSRARPRAWATSTSATSCPDYTAYEELLDVFKAFTAIPILLEGERGYAFTAEDLRREMLGRGLVRPALLQPLQPDRQAGAGRGAGALGGASPASWTARCSSTSSTRTTSGRAPPGRLPVESAARYVEDVDRDPVVLFDGLTKNWRYPGWRMTWTVGPRQVIDAVASAGQLPRRRRQPSPCSARRSRCWRRSTWCAETQAIHAAFREKRDRLPRGSSGWACARTGVPDGTFYVWGNVARAARAAQRRHGLLPRGAGARRSSACPASSST